MGVKHTSYPSRYRINESVILKYEDESILTNCKVVAVKFTESKVFYDIEVTFNKGSTILKEVDSLIVCDVE